MTEKELVCKRCGHEWDRVLLKLHHRVKLPKNCPMCNSPYWNRDRIRPYKEIPVMFEV